jgi:hypothetical protein
VFVAIDNNDGIFHRDVATTVDGISWTNHINAMSVQNSPYALGVDRVSGTFVSFTLFSTGAAYSTNNGVSWTDTSLPNGGGFGNSTSEIARNEATFCAVFDYSTPQQYVVRSTDGITGLNSLLPVGAVWLDNVIAPLVP